MIWSDSDMPLAKGQNSNRPQRESSIIVESIRAKTAMENVKKMLRDRPHSHRTRPTHRKCRPNSLTPLSASWPRSKRDATGRIDNA